MQFDTTGVMRFKKFLLDEKLIPEEGADRAIEDILTYLHYDDSINRYDEGYGDGGYDDNFQSGYNEGYTDGLAVGRLRPPKK